MNKVRTKISEIILFNAIAPVSLKIFPEEDYKVSPEVKDPEAIILATGSEVKVALDAAAELETENIAVRVVSVPSFEWFDAESAEYRETVLPKSIRARVSVEAGLALGWEKYTGAYGENVSIEHFGESADGALLLKKFGINSDAVTKAVKRSIEGAK